MRFITAAMALATSAVIACSPSADGMQLDKASAEKIVLSETAELPSNAVIYEVNIRQYTPAGTFAAFTKELPRIRKLGVDILWIMPVQPIGKLKRKGSLGSYYSIADYTAFNPEFGTQADFIAMVDAAHALGFKVILDWVANHTSHDHHWTREHPDWHTRRADGSLSRPIDPAGKETDWDDVADLNYGNREMRTAMIGEMRWWLDSTGIDGFRCDVAGFVPYDFWAAARAALQAVKPDLFMLAEWEDPKLHPTFEMTYGWTLFHVLNDVASGKQKASAIDTHFKAFEATFPDYAFRMNFTSNHDENSWNGTEFERMGANHLAAYVIAATTQKAMPLLYSGQEASFKRRLAFFEKDSIDWTGPSLAPFYSQVFELRHTQAVLWSGSRGARQLTLATDDPDTVYAFVRARGQKAVVVLVNFGDAPRTVRYTGLAATGDYTEWFDKSTRTLTAAGSIEIPAHGYRIFVK